MPQPRLPQRDLTPEYEDAGLFKHGVCQVQVELVPVVEQNSRGDINIKGFVKDDLEISVTKTSSRHRTSTPYASRYRLKVRGGHVYDEVWRGPNQADVVTN